MQNLDDLYFFAEVVGHGGFAAAGRALKVPKSKLSRRVADLEARLGVRLIERSSRRFKVTDIGQGLFARCKTIMADVAQAEIAVTEAHKEPKGHVRLSCPAGLVELVAEILPAFLARYPHVKVQVVVMNGPVNIIAERIDVALRVRNVLNTDADLTMRALGVSRRVLVANAAFANTLASHTDINVLGTVATLSTADTLGPVTWDLVGPDNATKSVTHEPRVMCSDFTALRALAAQGFGVALLPEHACHAGLVAGTLVRLFPEWHAVQGIVHAVFATRRALSPALRALVDHLAAQMSHDTFAPPSLNSATLA